MEGNKARLEVEPALLSPPAPAVVQIHPNVPELYPRCVAAPAALLEDEVARREALEIIRSLVDRVEVGPP